jgi:hypothetical protein
MRTPAVAWPYSLAKRLKHFVRYYTANGEAVILEKSAHVLSVDYLDVGNVQINIEAGYGLTREGRALCIASPEDPDRPFITQWGIADDTEYTVQVMDFGPLRNDPPEPAIPEDGQVCFFVFEPIGSEIVT